MSIENVTFDKTADLFAVRFDQPVNVTVKDGEDGNPGWLDREHIKSLRIEHPGVFRTTADGKMLFRDRTLISCLDGDESVIIPDGTDVIYKNAFKNNRAVKSVSIPGTVWKIGDWAFSNCPNLEHVTFPEGLQSIEDFAFDSSGIKSTVFPASLEHVGFKTFAECASLETVEFAKNCSVTELMRFTFVGCEKLSKVRLPDHLTRIGSSCFLGCKAFRTVYLPSSVESVESGALQYADNIHIAAVPDRLLQAVINLGNEDSYVFSINYRGCRFVYPRTFDLNKTRQAYRILRETKGKKEVLALSFAASISYKELGAYEAYRKYHSPAAKRRLKDWGTDIVRYSGFEEKKEQMLDILTTYKKAGILTRDMVEQARSFADQYSWKDVSAAVLDLANCVEKPADLFEL